MKRHPALALVELDDLPAGLHAVDAMLKRAPIACLRSGSVSRGRFLVLVGGTTAAVEEALMAGLAVGAESVLDHLLLADIHPRLHDAIVGARRPSAAGALALLETR
ncbi:MAG TPA: BMC domain-containing protein, partial [Thermoanaerobaculia bacterium]|nr:BMC domain-containing protein [Thermoanaerobaculia bacterium]